MLNKSTRGFRDERKYHSCFSCKHWRGFLLLPLECEKYDTNPLSYYAQSYSYYLWKQERATPSLLGNKGHQCKRDSDGSESFAKRQVEIRRRLESTLAVFLRKRAMTSFYWRSHKNFKAYSKLKGEIIFLCLHSITSPNLDLLHYVISQQI